MTKAVVTKVDGVDYHYVQVYGLAHRGKVKRYIEAGWEIVNYTPAVVGGMTLKQGMYAMRKRVSVDA